MSTRSKLAAAALGALVIVLLLLVPLVPTPTPPVVDDVELQRRPGSKQRTAAPLDTAAPGRRSQPDERRSRSSAPGGFREESAEPLADPRSGRRADATPPGSHPAADSPTGQLRNNSAPRRGGSPTPRTTPVRGNPPAPGEHAPQRSVPSESADPPDADATTAGADPPDEAEPSDPPDADPTTAGADPPDEPEPAGGDPLSETP